MKKQNWLAGALLSSLVLLAASTPVRAVCIFGFGSCKTYQGAIVTCEGIATTDGSVLAYDRSANNRFGYALVIRKGADADAVCKGIALSALNLKTERKGESTIIYGSDVDVAVKGLTGIKVTVNKF